MKVVIVLAKKQRKCSYCGSKVEKGNKLVETIDWIPNQKFPEKKNICFECFEVRIDFIPVLENLLMDLRTLKRKESEVIL